MPRQGNYTQEQVKALLNDYVFPKECVESVLATDLKPEMVATFLRERLTGEVRRLLSISRGTKLARFYVLRELVEQLRGLIAGGEKTSDDLARSCHLISAVCQLGDADLQAAAVKEYERLVADPVSEKDDAMGVLIETFFNLPPKTPPGAIRKRVAEARAACEKKGPEENLGQLMEYDIRLLPWVVSAKASKDFLLSKAPGPERLQGWAGAYLLLDIPSPFKWDDYAAFALLADARDQGDPAAVTAIKAAMARIDPEKDERELTQFRKTRGYRAREYFLDSLSEEEKRDNETNQQAQEDLLA